MTLRTSPYTPLCNPTNTLDTVTFSPVDTDKLIRSLPSSQSTDGDDLCYLLIKRGGFLLASKLSAFFNFSLASCSIPDGLRRIVVTPVHKSGTKDKCSNFRPIAITSCVCRIMERAIYKVMVVFSTLMLFYFRVNMVFFPEARWRQLTSFFRFSLP